MKAQPIGNDPIFRHHALKRQRNSFKAMRENVKAREEGALRHNSNLSKVIIILRTPHVTLNVVSLLHIKVNIK